MLRLVTRRQCLVDSNQFSSLLLPAWNVPSQTRSLEHPTNICGDHESPNLSCHRHVPLGHQTYIIMSCSERVSHDYALSLKHLTVKAARKVDVIRVNQSGETPAGHVRLSSPAKTH